MAETPMSNEVRRLLAHLGVPRTLAGLTERLHVDPDVGALAVDVSDLLDEAEKNGWVVALGRASDPDDAVKAVEESSDAVGFGKGQAKIWKERAELGRYDVGSDLFMLSQEGLEALQGTDEDEEQG